MIMIHPDIANINRHDYYKAGWLGKHAPSAAELADLITKGCWSPCLWRGGVRLEKNFKLATWLALDFDENVTLADAKHKFEGYLHVIGTTAHHQIPKGDKPPCDRFRVVLRFLETCRFLADYEETVRKMVRIHSADRACIDGARKFKPCKKIVSIKYYGKGLHPVDGDKAVERRNAAINRKINLENARYGKSIPLSVHNKLRFGAVGSRNSACYGIGKDLSRRGFGENEIVEIIMGSNIPLRTGDKNIENEVREAVRSALRSSYT